MKGTLLAVGLSVMAAVFSGRAHAQVAPRGAYPTKPIRVLVPFPPGGTPDIQFRVLAEKLVPRFDQQFVIDNRAGASGNIAMDIAARAPADGYTLIIATVGNYAVNPHLYKLPFDVAKDFAPIIHIATTPAVLVVHPSVPANTVKELIALAQHKPGELNYGSSGVGGFGHMCAELFAAMTGIRMTHVPYKGAAAAQTDLIGGHIQVLFNSAVPTMPHIKAGRVRALATTGATRLPILPDLPTVAEAGVPHYENSTWSMISAPARTPRAIIERLNLELNAVLQMPEIKERFAAAGSAVTGGTAKQAQDILKSELAKFGKLVREAGISAAAGA
jgi:tripartite-type tricarboxylate transporter receptor subunit TctC